MIFSKGINLGGWLSQYRIYDLTHFESFIKEEDLERIASWGLDHVRLPVDYPLLESQTEEGGFEVAGFEYIDRCLGWCRQRYLDLIIDLHNAPGYDFDNWQAITLFDDPSLLARFINIWAAIARHYRGTANIAFELLNEIMIPDSKPWNQLVGDAIAAIHSIDPPTQYGIHSITIIPWSLPIRRRIGIIGLRILPMAWIIPASIRISPLSAPGILASLWIVTCWKRISNRPSTSFSKPVNDSIVVSLESLIRHPCLLG